MSKIMSTPNHVIMKVTTFFSRVVHALLFLGFGANLFYFIYYFSQHKDIKYGEIIAIALFIFWMYHCLSVIFLLEEPKVPPFHRTWGHSMVTVVMEIIIIPVYTLLFLGGFSEKYGYMLLICVLMLLVSMIGNIYCILRHTLLK